MAQVWHYDGSSGIRYDADLTPTEGGFRLLTDHGDVSDYRWSDLIARNAQGNAQVFGLAGRQGWRIGFEGGVPGDIAPLLPKGARYGKLIDRIGVGKASAIFVGVSALVLFIGLSAPGWIAPRIPWSYEQKLGDAMVGDLGGRFCKGPGGEAALAALVRRIDPGGRAVDVHVVHIAMVNAVTLPGGKILVFDGLLKQANSADELAGVIGHELGHVRHGDVMQALVRQAGLSVLLGGFGGNMGGNLNTMLSASYSRGAESAADDYAIYALKHAQISPHDTAGFFTRLGKQSGNVEAAFAYVASHPVSTNRATHFESSVVKGASYTPALSEDQWAALADICHNDPARKKDDGFNPFD